MVAESWVVYEVLKTWGAHPRLRMWRNNTGVGWFNDNGPCRKTDPGARPVKFGVEGQGDISGIIDGGRRLEIECKTAKGKQREAQIAFEAMITRFGGLYVLVRNVAELDSALAVVGITR
jgi:hypothetical protein